MLQTIAGKSVYVVEFDTMPELPITGLTEHEVAYNKILGKLIGNLNGLTASLSQREDSVYARALTAAIETGVITEPGKYGIHIYMHGDDQRWEAFKIVE